MKAAAKSGLSTDGAAPFDREIAAALEKGARELWARAEAPNLSPEAAARARRRAALLEEPDEAPRAAGG
jgi:hypothetical protein